MIALISILSAIVLTMVQDFISIPSWDVGIDVWDVLVAWMTSRAPTGSFGDLPLMIRILVLCISTSLLGGIMCALGLGEVLARRQREMTLGQLLDRGEIGPLLRCSIVNVFLSAAKKGNADVRAMPVLDAFPVLLGTCAAACVTFWAVPYLGMSALDGPTSADVPLSPKDILTKAPLLWAGCYAVAATILWREQKKVRKMMREARPTAHGPVIEPMGATPSSPLAPGAVVGPRTIGRVVSMPDAFPFDPPPAPSDDPLSSTPHRSTQL